MKPELLSPAGNFECLKAAIMAGCDAVYLGGKLFGARAFSDNFSDEELVEAINYSHLYGVKVYVTINTLIYENEINKFLNYVEFLYKNNVDALIIQDIGMMDLVRKMYPKLELHASTQMHIHNLEGVKLIEKLGLKRVVLARETSIDLIRKIKSETNVELEVFVQGALCISYSGQCLMSSLIGNRSGNRGTCAGSCRQKYNLINEGKKLNKDNYLLSTKDLCSLEYIGNLIDIGVDSFKIEGRMKSKEYVYLVTSIYRKAIDSYFKNKKVDISESDIKNLKKIFNREFTKGFLNNASNDDIINPVRPNNIGIEIGKVIKWENNYVYIKLNDDLNINDGIRFKENDIGFIVTQIFKNRVRVNNAKSGEIISIFCKDKIKPDSLVLKTTDYLLNKNIDECIEKRSRKIKLDFKLEAFIGQKLKLELTDGINAVVVYGDIVEQAINNPISEQKLKEQMSKLGNTIYEVNNMEILTDGSIFIPIKNLNEIRRRAIEEINKKRLYSYDFIKNEYDIEIKDYPSTSNYNILINNLEQYEIIKQYKFNNIYMDKELYTKIDDSRKILKIERVNEKYSDEKGPLLVGELGSIYKYKNVYTDFSLNVTNSYSVAFLHSLNVDKVTLSYELNDYQIKNIVDNYIKRYNKRPNLELIIYGKEEAMISKFNLNKLYNVNASYLQDRFGKLYPVITKDNLMKIYNYKTRYIKDYKKYFDLGINNLRFIVLDEDLHKIENLFKKM